MMVWITVVVMHSLSSLNAKYHVVYAIIAPFLVSIPQDITLVWLQGTYIDNYVKLPSTKQCIEMSNSTTGLPC